MSTYQSRMPEAVFKYYNSIGYREPAILAEIRAATAALPRAEMQLSADEGQLLQILVQIMGAKPIVVLGHTSCGAIKGACDDVKLGNLTGLLARIKPAIEAVPNGGQDRSSKNHAFVELVAESNVRLAVQMIRDQSPVLREMEQKGEILIVGAMVTT